MAFISSVLFYPGSAQREATCEYRGSYPAAGLGITCHLSSRIESLLQAVSAAFVRLGLLVVMVLGA